MRRTRRGSCGGQMARQDPSPRIGFLSEELFGPHSVCHFRRLFRFTPEHFFFRRRPVGGLKRLSRRLRRLTNLRRSSGDRPRRPVRRDVVDSASCGAKLLRHTFAINILRQVRPMSHADSFERPARYFNEDA
jgi:hypothetical protein